MDAYCSKDSLLINKNLGDQMQNPEYTTAYTYIQQEKQDFDHTNTFSKVHGYWIQLRLILV